MKKKNLLFLVLALGIIVPYSANATIWTITAYSTPVEEFSPSGFTVTCGDTIAWVNGNGVHTCASTTIPGGAQSWSSPDLSATPYYYVPTIAGTYNYTCHPLVAAHMDASFIVTCPAGIEDHNLNSISVFPNPSSTGFFHLTGVPNEAEVIVYDQLGRTISIPSSTDSWLDFQEMENGIYFVHFEYKNQRMVKKLIKD